MKKKPNRQRTASTTGKTWSNCKRKENPITLIHGDILHSWHRHNIFRRVINYLLIDCHSWAAARGQAAEKLQLMKQTNDSCLDIKTKKLISINNALIFFIPCSFIRWEFLRPFDQSVTKDFHFTWKTVFFFIKHINSSFLIINVFFCVQF